MATPLTARSANGWVVQGDGVASGRLAERLRTDPEITQLKQVARDVVVLAMTAERAERLRKEFGDQLVIEPDVDLKLDAGPSGA